MFTLIFSLLFQLRSHYYDYFSGDHHSISFISTPIRSFTTNVWISHTSFYNFFSNLGTGGAFFISQVPINAVIEFSTFYHCQTGNFDGGAVYFDCPVSGAFVINSICAYHCQTGAGNSFQFYFARTDPSKINRADLISVANSSFSIEQRKFYICLDSGNQYIYGLN